MITIDQVQNILNDIAESIPREFYTDLNGGILLLPEAKASPYAQKNDLWIMGEYCRGGSMGRLIKIYFGSFEKMYYNLSEEELRERLRHTLLHEFTHHVESLAGEKGLEDWDEKQIEAYLNSHCK